MKLVNHVVNAVCGAGVEEATEHTTGSSVSSKTIKSGSALSLYRLAIVFDKPVSELTPEDFSFLTLILYPANPDVRHSSIEKLKRTAKDENSGCRKVADVLAVSMDTDDVEIDFTKPEIQFEMPDDLSESDAFHFGKMTNKTVSELTLQDFIFLRRILDLPSLCIRRSVVEKLGEFIGDEKLGRCKLIDLFCLLSAQCPAASNETT